MNDQKNTIKDTKTNEQNAHGIIDFIKWFAHNRKMQFLFLFLLVALPIVIIIYSIVIPVSTFEPLAKNKVSIVDTSKFEPAKIDNEQKIKIDAIMKKEQELLFQQNRFSLAKQDSIYLVLNLADSIISLEIKGLEIKSCKIHSYKASNQILKAQHENLLEWLKDPFTLQGEFATIPKVPVIFIDAPKDTAEAARLPRKPLEPENALVNFTLLFNNQLALEVEQFEPPLPEDMESLKRYQMQTDSVFKRNIFRKLIDPMPENQTLRINIVINGVDARAIYRAIPHSNSAKLIVKL